MSFSLLHKVVAYLISGLGLVALSLGDEVTDFTVVLTFMGFAASWFAEEPLIARPRYASVWTTLVVGLLLLQLTRAVMDAPTLAMAIEFAAFLQVSRLFNRRSAADYQQIAVLAFLHLIAATVLSTSLSYALLFIGFVVATPWMLALSHLRREIEGNYPAASDVDPQARTAIRRVLASKRVVGPGFLVGTALLALPLFAMTLAIFVTIPRVGKGFLSFSRDGGTKVAGFGNQIELGGFGVIRDDPTVVLRVTPLPRVDEKAPRLTLRLRGTSFDHYDGRRWTRSPSTAQGLPGARPRFGPRGHQAWNESVVRRRPPTKARQFEIVLDHLDDPVVFLPHGTVALSLPPRIENAGRIRRRVTVAPGLDVRYGSPDGLGLLYKAYVSRDPYEAELPRSELDDHAQYLQVPKGHERVAALARQIVGSATDPMERIERVERHLKLGDYRYSLEQPEVKEGELPLEVFLLDKKHGHCEYYSSSMAIMLRTLGIPTRNVTGFVGGRYNPYGRYYALRQGDAHSWVEVFVEGRGWITHDPTPPARAGVGPRQGLWADLNAVIDAMRTRWITSVVGYDLRTQIGMLQRMARWLSSRRSGDSGGSAEEASTPTDWRSMLRSARDVIGGAVVLVLLFLIWRTIRGPKDGGTRLPSKREAAALTLYRELERALAKRGVARPPTRTPQEHARDLSEQGFDRIGDVETVTSTYLEVRFGDRELTEAELTDLKDAVARVRKAA